MPQVGLYAAFLTLLFPPHLSSSTVSSSSSSSCDLAVAPPSHGDLWLQESTGGLLLVLIYMGPDGTDYPQMWGTLSASGIKNNVKDTICRQLGYAKGTITSTKDSGRRGPVWISDIDCPPETKHILRCTYRFNSSSDHTNDIHLICDEDSTRSQSNDNTYDGQAALLPPFSAVDCNRSRSYGVVTIKIDSYWRFLYCKSKHLLSRNVTDTLCREMGFTHSVPNSLWTIGQAKMAQISNANVTTYDFSLFVDLDVSKFSCAKAFPCIGCSKTKYVFGEDMPPAAIFNGGKMHQNDAMILRCSFYSSDLYLGQNISAGDSILPGGDRSHCDLSGGSMKDSSICSDEKFISLPERKFIAAFAVPVGFLLLIIIALIFARPIIRKYRDWRYRDYNELHNEDNVRQPLAVQPAPGNH